MSKKQVKTQTTPDAQRCPNRRWDAGIVEVNDPTPPPPSPQLRKQRRRRDFYDLDTSHWQLTGAARPAASLPGAGGTELVNERDDWEEGEDLFEKLGGVRVGGGGGTSDGDSSDSDSESASGGDDIDGDDEGKRKGGGDKEGKGGGGKDDGNGSGSGGSFYEGPEACREYLGEGREVERERPLQLENTHARQHLCLHGACDRLTRFVFGGREPKCEIVRKMVSCPLEYTALQK